MVRVRGTWISTAVFLLYWRAETLWMDIWVEKKERRGRYEESTWESRGKKMVQPGKKCRVDKLKNGETGWGMRMITVTKIPEMRETA